MILLQKRYTYHNRRITKLNTRCTFLIINQSEFQHQKAKVDNHFPFFSKIPKEFNCLGNGNQPFLSSTYPIHYGNHMYSGNG